MQSRGPRLDALVLGRGVFGELGSWRGEEGDSVASAAPALRPAAAWNPLMP